MRGAVRRYDPVKRELLRSEVLRRGSRHFQLAAQLGLLECGGFLDRATRDPLLTSEESRALARMALANYFAAAVPVGITCRLCERTDCQARAFPSLRSELRIDENVRGMSFFAPVE